MYVVCVYVCVWKRDMVRLKRLDPPLAAAETDDPWVERSLCGKDSSSMPRHLHGSPSCSGN